MLQNDQKLLIQLADNSKLLHSLLDKMCTTGALVLTGTPASPLFHLVGSDALLQLIVDLSFKDGLVLVRAKYIADQEHSKSPQSSIRITASAGFTKREVERGCQILREAIKRAIRLVKA